MTRVVTIDEARALLAAEVTTTCDECRDKATGVCLACHLPLCGRHREHANNFGVRCGGVIGPTADDLAASLIAQTAENERLTALAAARDDRIGDLCDEAGLLREEIDEAHATIERQSVVGGIASKEIARLRAEVAVWRERPDGAQTQHALDIERAKSEHLAHAINEAVEGLDGEHAGDCPRSEHFYARCDCAIGRVHAALTKAARS